ncbi:MAG: hypothetical protein KDK70_30675 [Myxococcales bacterium]|nr:hypothetical protein [Myxococcales bacterium]
MGVSIHVIVDPTCIARAVWERVYHETVDILRGWPDPPLRPVRREVAGVDVVVYTRDVVVEHGWHICGDATSRRLGESIELSSVLGVDRPRTPPSDLLARILASREPPYDAQGLEWLLGNKTQGKPFHALVLAVAMLIEHRLPQAALVGGDFTPDEARAAGARVQEILGEEISLPLCAEPERLRERLRPLVREAELVLAVETLSCRGPLAGILLGLLDGSLGAPGSYNRQQIERAVACTDVSTLDLLTRQAFEFMMGQSKALFGQAMGDGPGAPLGLPRKLCALGAGELLEIIACGTRATYLRLTEMAWQEIQCSPLPELRLLALLATHATAGTIAQKLRRAVFESTAIRRFCVEAWARTEPVAPQRMPVQARLFEMARGS